ncbi:phosphodiester glycosidase family protein [Candidatus Magnetobacterium casense]|uniref:Phosphodiester glycosidase family protein n=1 Tax=Candidatus Magnetobacterium casense TaxID=1455061 RepID=A0ABS6RXB4_9BACT|nr:phosphodiester glycosidase family protein [Candidatus Magnetobacterium casensis]MBV6340990.1 phosphodiester glycosidase family protein [Candidatus Magnetobacterium casensis]
MKVLIFYIGLCLLPLYVADAVSANNTWGRVDDGLFVREFDQPATPEREAHAITVVKVDPALYSFKLLTISEYGGDVMTVKEWARRYNLILAVNAGMYQADGTTNVGFMKNFRHVNNPGLARAYKSFFAFNPAVSYVPSVLFVDVDCHNFAELKDKYNTFIQNIRMISCRQKNVWSQQPGAWSMVVLGMDKSGNVLLIFTHMPYTVHDFIDVLLKLPISITNAMYLEGGKQASLYLSVKDTEIQRSGDDEQAWPIPNIIGIVKKTGDGGKIGRKAK